MMPPLALLIKFILLLTIFHVIFSFNLLIANWRLRQTFFSLAMATKIVAAWSADVNGCFLTGGRTNRLDRQIVSENKIAKGMNKFFNEQIID